MLFHKVDENSQYMQVKLYSGQVQNTYAFMTSYYSQNYIAYDTQLYYPQNSQQMMYYLPDSQMYGYPQKDEGYDSSLLNGDSAEEAQENLNEENIKYGDSFLEARQSTYDTEAPIGLKFEEQLQKRKRGSSFDSSWKTAFQLQENIPQMLVEVPEEGRQELMKWKSVESSGLYFRAQKSQKSVDKIECLSLREPLSVRKFDKN